MTAVIVLLCSVLAVVVSADFNSILNRESIPTLYMSQHRGDGVAAISSWLDRKDNNRAYDILVHLNASLFLDVMAQAGLDSLLQNPQLNSTIFAPNNEAMKTVPLVMKKNSTLMGEILRYHIASGYIMSYNITNNGLLKSYAKHGIPPNRIRLMIRTNVYKRDNSKVLSVCGAELINRDNKGTGVVVHLIDKPMFRLPVGSAYILQQPDFSILKGLLAKSIALMRVLSDLKRNITFFAPTNDAFKILPSGVLSKLENNIVLLTQVIVRHIATDIYYTVGFSNSRKQVDGVPGNKLFVNKSKNNYLVSDGKNQATVTYPDIPVLNGVVHGISRVLYSPKSGVDVIG